MSILNIRKIELLAPARDLECGIAAIDCGADAVYIGGPKFGAREAAGTSVEDISRLIEHAHRYWARVYVTVNTLLHDEEIAPALATIRELYKAGVDAVIVQDAGLLESELPPVPIIASTQMHNNTPERVKFLEDIGISRAILARELDLEQIKSIREQTSIELEYFVHGALCVSYSGQCYLSYAIGGRSGNRGQCAQPCRKLYTLEDRQGRVIARDKHLLSIRDLNLSEDLRELIDAGVTSFKIEGRLKDRAYVSNVVAAYRAKLDELLPEMGFVKSSSGTSNPGFTPDILKTFNRGYGKHFLYGRKEHLGCPDTPKMIGEVVGRVASVGAKSFVFEGSAELHPGDGVCFFNTYGALVGTTINRVDGKIVTPDKIDGIQSGVQLLRNHDHKFLQRLAKNHAERKIAVEFALRESPDGFVLNATDEDGISVEFELVNEKVPANTPERSLETIQSQLTKTGDSAFDCSGVVVELENVPFLSMSKINELRRGAIGLLRTERDRLRPRETGEIAKNDVPYPEKTLDYHGNVLNSRAAAFYKRHGVQSIDRAAESGMDLLGKQVMTTRYCLRHESGACPKIDRSADASPVFLISGEGDKLEVRFDCAHCEMHVFLTRKWLDGRTVRPKS